MLIFAALLICCFVLGIILHVVLYEPTAMLPAIWRNLLRYVAGVGAVLAVQSIMIVLMPEMTLWQMFGVSIAFFVMTGLGVAAGYILAGD